MEELMRINKRQPSSEISALTLFIILNFCHSSFFFLAINIVQESTLHLDD